ncbi:hypothetical protein D4764_06G0008100 [Takifugu flavidus]|uniref:Reverse transcriptase domain-containing protein n=1 Tax=Takifugu flavidus TaxID=433684 RepID=A0A5C6N0T3_9TELE|nr:hypothetical protein D4764_06G0008100 [Takifugu flavidus]
MFLRAVVVDTTLQHLVDIGAVPLDSQTGVVVPLFKKGDQRSNLGFRRNNVVFVLAVERWTSSTPSAGSSRVRGVGAQPVHMCFVDLEKAFDCVPRGVLWGVLLASSARDLQLPLDWFAAEYEAAGMRISISKVECLLWVMADILP